MLVYSLNHSRFIHTFITNTFISWTLTQNSLHKVYKILDQKCSWGRHSHHRVWHVPQYRHKARKVFDQKQSEDTETSMYLDIQGNPGGCQELWSFVRRWEPCVRAVAGTLAAHQPQPACYWQWSGVHQAQMVQALHLHYQQPRVWHWQLTTEFIKH